MSSSLESLAEKVLDRARGLGLMIATAESCTGGLVAAALTSIAGSSDVFERGFVTYSNEAKEEMLGIDPALIAGHTRAKTPSPQPSPQGERESAADLSSRERAIRASSLPAASACGCGHAEMQARQGELAGRETE